MPTKPGKSSKPARKRRTVRKKAAPAPKKAAPAIHASRPQGKGATRRAASADSPRIGLALGGGGAKGIAHVVILEAFDEMGLKPAVIAGSSIGALIGAIYASGDDAATLRNAVKTFTRVRRDTIRQLFSRRERLKVKDLLAPASGGSGIFKSDPFLKLLFDEIHASTFADLQIPLAVVAADFWKREEVVLREGPLMPAVRASLALPGLFSPEVMGDRVLVDGGTVNPVPYDVIADECDLVIAVDVIGERVPPKKRLTPSGFDAVFNTFQIMQRSIFEQKVRNSPPDVIIRAPLVGIRTLDFHKASEIYKEAAPAKDEVKRVIDQALEHRLKSRAR